MATKKTAPPFTPPAWIDPETWDAYTEMRREKGKRAPFTDKARDMIVRKLDRLRAEGHNPNDILAESVMNGWTGVFPLKAQPQAQQQQRTNAPDPNAPWHATRAGVEAKGVELGLGRWDQRGFELGQGESFPAYERRVRRAAGELGEVPANLRSIAGVLKRVGA